jgi:hypothetical protein
MWFFMGLFEIPSIFIVLTPLLGFVNRRIVRLWRPPEIRSPAKGYDRAFSAGRTSI